MSDTLRIDGDPIEGIRRVFEKTTYSVLEIEETVAQSFSLVIRQRQCALRLVIANEVDVHVVLGVVLIVGNSDSAHGLGLKRQEGVF